MSDFEHQHPRGRAGRFTAAQRPAPIGSLVPEEDMGPETIGFDEAVATCGVTDREGVAFDIKGILGVEAAEATFVRRELPLSELSGWVFTPDSYRADRDDRGARKVEAIARAYRSNPDAVPPILVAVMEHDGEQTIQVIDGIHRVSAAALAGESGLVCYEAIP